VQNTVERQRLVSAQRVLYYWVFAIDGAHNLLSCLSISDSVVSHVCAVNLFDGTTPLHHIIERGDSVNIACAVIEADRVVVNMQNDAGLTPVHLACKLGRKKILEKLLVGGR